MSGNRILLVMRHSKSSWKTNEPDQRRPLSGRGVRDAVVAGQTLAPLSPDVVWCSSAARAVQTWQCAQMGGASSADVRFDDALYGASGRQLLGLIRTSPDDARTVLVIAHEPGVSELVGLVGAPGRLTDEVEARFPTSAIAVLSLASSWADLDAGAASVDSFTVPRG